MADEFSIAWRVLDARGWGVPQRRRRIFLVLDLDGQSAGEISFKRPGLRRNFKALRKEGKTPSSSVEGSSGEASGSVPYTLKIRSGCAGGEGRLNSGGPVCDPGNEQRSIPVPTTVSSPGIRVQSGSVREGPGHRVGGGDIPDSGSQYVGDRTDSVLPDAFAIENHPQDCRVKLSEDGTVQTLAARMGTGGGEHAYCPPVLFRQEQYGSYVQGEVSATLVTHRTYLTLNIVAQHLPSADKSSASS